MTYVYEIEILQEPSLKTVYKTTARGKNQREAVKNFREKESDIRQKYIDDKHGYRLGVKRLCKSLR